MKLRKFIATTIREYLNEQQILNENIEVAPNISRSSGFGLDLVYLSISKSYAIAYANGQTSAAHEYRNPINNGTLFYVCLDENTQHFGGDIWVSGYKDEIIDDLKEYKLEWNQEDDYSEHDLERLTKYFLSACGVGEEPTLANVDYVLSFIKKDNLSLMSPFEWSSIQEQFGGYSEICLKNITEDKILKVELYENGDLVKEINGKYKHSCETIFYHGSPLKFWKHLL
jgi:hypothetical protein